MIQNNAPAFRSSVGGYKKQDVNAYIINLSKIYSENERGYKEALAAANAELDSLRKAAADMSKKLSDNETENQSLALHIKQLEESLYRAEEAKKELGEKADELARLAEMKSAPEANDLGGLTTETEKAVMFDCISAKTGEIMLIACKTADEIVTRANEQAAAILGEANAKKDNMLNNISTSADSVVSDISSYIRNAVDGCLDKIYSSIKTVNSDTNGKKND